MVIILILALISFSFAQDTLIYWEPEQRLTYDSIPQLHSQVWAYDSFVHILVNYDVPTIYLRSWNYGMTWSDTICVVGYTSTGSQTLVQQDSVVYFSWSEHREGPPKVTLIDTQYIFFRRSNDYGATLDSAIFLGKGWDLDISALGDSVFDVTCYYIQPPPPIGAYLCQSFDGGFNWSGFLPIVDSSETPNIVYRNNVLHFAGWRNYKIIYTRSTDLGNTWSTPTIITAPNTVLPKRPNLALGPNQDLYIAWTDNKFGGGMQFDDVMFRKSTDDGFTWGPEQRLTPDSHCDAGGALDMVSQDSMIFIVWDYNGIGYPAPCSLFFLASTDHGESWRERELIKGGSGFGLHDANVATAQDYVYVVWEDNEDSLYTYNGDLRIRRGSFTPPGIEERTPASVSSVNVYPNPFREKIQIRYMMQDTGSNIQSFSLKIYDVSGKEVVVLGHQNIRESGDECIIKKVVKLK